MRRLSIFAGCLACGAWLSAADGPGPGVSTAAKGVTVRVAAISFVPVKFDLKGNAERLVKAFRAAHEGGAKIAVAPEGVLEGYVVNEIIAGKAPPEAMKDVAVTMDGPVIRRFQDLARELHMCLVFGFAERIKDEVFNCAVFIDDAGRICGRHHKMQLAEGSHPDWWFNRLGAHSRAFDTPYGRCGIVICNERWNPQLARILALDGARFLVIPSYGTKGESQDKAVLRLATENSVPIVEANVGVTLLVNEGRISVVNRKEESITFGEITIPASVKAQPEERDRAEHEFLVWRETEMKSRHSKTMAGLKNAQTAPEKVTVVYKQAGGVDIKADVFATAAKEPRPAVVWIHGGGLINGHREQLFGPVRDFAFANGYVLVSLDYRLAPETRLPEILSDIEDALQWLRTEGVKRFNIDPNRMAVAGGSAGGFLTLAAGFRVNPAPQVLCSFWGYGEVLTDWASAPSPHARHHQTKVTAEEALRHGSGPPVADSRERQGNGAAIYAYGRQSGEWAKLITGADPRREPERLAPWLPLKNVTAKYPPTVLVHGTTDTDVPFEQSQLMTREFEKHGVAFELHPVAGAEHGLAGGKPEEIAEAYRKAFEFVQRELRKAAPTTAPAPVTPVKARVLQRAAKDTITPIELDWGDVLEFKLRNGETRKLKLLKTEARVVEGSRLNVKKYAFTASFALDGESLQIERVVPAQESFYEPVVMRGMRIWLDAVSDIFQADGGFMLEKDAGIGIVCQPKRKARLAVNDVQDRICPEKLVWWYPEKGDRLDVRNSYRGEDVWMGPYDGKLAHGGLDINMKSGTPLHAPIDFDDQFLFNSLAAGHNNNRWRGIRRWPNGSVWWLQAHHLNKMVVPERTPLKQGQLYAETAGVHIGAREHSHFAWRITEEGEDYWLDPWIFFWQTFQDQKK